MPLRGTLVLSEPCPAEGGVSGEKKEHYPTMTWTILIHIRPSESPRSWIPVYTGMTVEWWFSHSLVSNRKWTTLLRVEGSCWGSSRKGGISSVLTIGRTQPRRPPRFASWTPRPALRDLPLRHYILTNDAGCREPRTDERLRRHPDIYKNCCRDIQMCLDGTMTGELAEAVEEEYQSTFQKEIAPQRHREEVLHYPCDL